MLINKSSCFSVTITKPVSNLLRFELSTRLLSDFFSQKVSAKL